MVSDYYDCYSRVKGPHTPRGPPQVASPVSISEELPDGKVTIPCGHNLCKTCFTQHWNVNVPYKCPSCKEVFYTRPEQKVNTFIYKTHDVVPLKERYEGKKAKLGKTDAEIQQMIQKRRLKIQEMKRSVEFSKKDADREIAAGVQVFSTLKESVERSQAELIDTIKEKQRQTEKQVEGLIKELEQEISELEKRSSEVEQLSQSEDHLHLLQSSPSLNTAPPTKDWTGVSVRPPSYEGTVVRAVNQLEETLSKQMKKLSEAELKRVQQYAVDVTLDPDTANPDLILSDDGKQVYDSDVRRISQTTQRDLIIVVVFYQMRVFLQ
ncbi:zinc finger protein RFP-like [Sparus aurata]|uniref:zinc finger protein RFP-like n=1 Tax=Sparus aurata TaxID=8175 RepID=UPI0011C18383|nr:zinc finger protein RFP-like [Sparus aurata]